MNITYISQKTKELLRAIYSDCTDAYNQFDAKSAKHWGMLTLAIPSVYFFFKIFLSLLKTTITQSFLSAKFLFNIIRMVLILIAKVAVMNIQGFNYIIPFPLLVSTMIITCLFYAAFYIKTSQLQSASPLTQDQQNALATKWGKYFYYGLCPILISLWTYFHYSNIALIIHSIFTLPANIQFSLGYFISLFFYYLKIPHTPKALSISFCISTGLALLLAFTTSMPVSILITAVVIPGVWLITHILEDYSTLFPPSLLKNIARVVTLFAAIITIIPSSPIILYNVILHAIFPIGFVCTRKNYTHPIFSQVLLSLSIVTSCYLIGLPISLVLIYTLPINLFLAYYDYNQQFRKDSTKDAIGAVLAMSCLTSATIANHIGYYFAAQVVPTSTLVVLAIYSGVITTSILNQKGRTTNSIRTHYSITAGFILSTAASFLYLASPTSRLALLIYKAGIAVNSCSILYMSSVTPKPTPNKRAQENSILSLYGHTQ